MEFLYTEPLYKFNKLSVKKAKKLNIRFLKIEKPKSEINWNLVSIMLVRGRHWIETGIVLIIKARKMTWKH